MESEKPSTAKLAFYLKGISFPCDKNEIVNTAEQNGAPDDILDVLRNLPERKYNNATDVEKQFNQIKETTTMGQM